MLQLRALTVLLLVSILGQSSLTPLATFGRNIAQAPQHEPTKAAPRAVAPAPKTRARPAPPMQNRPTGMLLPWQPTTHYEPPVPESAPPTPPPAAVEKPDLPLAGSDPDVPLGYGPAWSTTLGGGNPAVYNTTCQIGKYPIDCASGNFWHTFPEMAGPEHGPYVQFSRTYNSLSAITPTLVLPTSQAPKPLGAGWTHSYNMFIDTDDDRNPAYVHQENGSRLRFENPTAGNYDKRDWIMADLTYNAANSTWTFTRTKTLEVFTFAPKNVSGTNIPMLTQIKDRNGYITTLAYTNNYGLPSSVTGPDGHTFEFTYNANSRLTNVLDTSNSRVLTYTYDLSNRLQDAWDVAGNNRAYLYDAFNEMTAMYDPLGGVITNTYEVSTGRILDQEDPLHRHISFARDDYVFTELGLSGTITITDNLSRTTEHIIQSGKLKNLTLNPNTPIAATYVYTWAGGGGVDTATLGNVKDPLGNVVTYTWSNNNLTSVQDPLGATTVFTYNATSDLIEVRNAKNITTTFGYDAYGNMIRITQHLTNTNSFPTTTFGYDPNKPGDVMTITNPLGKSWNFVHDYYGYIITGTNPLGESTGWRYDDSRGWLKKITSPLGNVTQYDYTRYGDVAVITNTLGYTTTYTYDKNRNVKTATDANYHTTSYNYNDGNELIRVIRPDGTHSDAYYDKVGNIISTTNGLTQTTRYNYDVQNRVITVTDALTRSTVYTYDLASHLTVMTDAKGLRTSLAYDAAGQLKTITYSDGTTPNVAYNYDVLGQRTVMTDGTGTTHYTYDSLNRLTQMEQGDGETVGYEYDLANQMWRITYPTANDRVTYWYNDAGRIYESSNFNQGTWHFQYDYDQDGNLTQVTYPQPNTNPPTTELTYDHGQLNAITHTIDSEIFAYHYSYDHAGLMTGVTEGTPSHAYTYDTLNRLTGDQLSGVQSISSTWGYDGAYEITGSTYTYPAGPGTVTKQTKRTYDAANELLRLTEEQGVSKTRDITFTFDLNGNRTYQRDAISGDDFTYTYDQANRLKQITGNTIETVVYGYNGDGLRMSKTAPPAVTTITPAAFTWDIRSGVPLLLREDLPDQHYSYVYGPGGMLLSQVAEDGTTYFYYGDRLGSIRVTSDVDGKVTNTYEYDAYGNTTSTSGSAYNPFRYAGEYTDPESGFLYLRARYYDPVTQQFLTVDPLLALTGQAYNYVEGNPVNKVDPEGLLAVGVCVAVYAYLGAGIVGMDCLVWTSSGEVGEQVVFGFIAATNAALAVGIVVLISPEANTLKDMEGWFVGGGVAGGPELRFLGFDWTAGRNAQGNLINCYAPQVGIGPSAAPVELHGGLTYTLTKWSVNLNSPFAALAIWYNLINRMFGSRLPSISIP